ncbi:MAG: hypothetical protein J5497_08585, partial [Selenomonadaceae bacterium]|nr:hypothetical protein [Selenomonadaceae bacterium]
TAFIGNDALNDTIIAADGASGIAIYGLGGDDKLGGGSATQVKLAGGSGADEFIFGGGNDTITDYTYSDSDKVTFGDGFDIDSITTVSTVTDGTKLDFGTTDALTFNGISVADTVNVDNINWHFYGESNAILTDDKAGGIFLSNVSLSLGANDIDTNYSALHSVTLKAGGFVTAGGLSDYAHMKVVGNHEATLIGSDNTTDYFTYAGGSVTIRSYIEDPDDIFIGEGFTITGQSCPMSDDALPNVTLTVEDAVNNSIGTILLEGVVTDNPHKTEILVYYEAGGTQAIPLTADHFDNVLKPSAREVSIVGGGKTRDYGIQSTTPSAQESLYTAEYFNDLKQIKATTDDSTIIGNKESNVFIAMGGDSNLFTGGMGSDTFIFGSQSNASGYIHGGGIITDFGAGATKCGDSSLLAQSPTQQAGDKQIAYNRNDPTTYAEGNDVLKVNGTVVEIAFKYYDSTKTNTAKQPVFSAYVTYDEDDNHTNGNEHTILLGNIAKPASKYNDDINKATYKTDAVVART